MTQFWLNHQNKLRIIFTEDLFNVSGSGLSLGSVTKETKAADSD